MYNYKSVSFCVLLALLGCALTNVEASSSTVSLHIFSGSSIWWVAAQPQNDQAATAKIEMHDSKSSTFVTMQANPDWGYYSYSSTSNGGFVAPLTFRLTSKSGAQITVTTSTLTPDAVIDTGASYSGGSSTPSTSAPTTKPTSAPPANPTTKPATSAPTTAPKPTTKPSTAPTTKPATSAPTAAPTTKPTSTGSSTQAPGGRMCAAGQVWAPRPGTTWQWQLTGTIDTSIDVQMYDIDLFDNTAATISTLHSKGRAVICYFSTQYENWRPDAASWPTSILGSNLDDWPGERYADIRSPILRSLMTARLDLAVSKGCDGVEPDNVDSYANSNGLGLTAADQIDFNKFMATEAHKRGLSVGLKNDMDQINSLVSSYDWALNEQCNEYGECSGLSAFVSANKAVFGTEYKGSASSFCPSMVNSKFSWLLKNLNLDASIGAQCCTYATGGCAATKAAYSCVSYASKRSLDGTEVMEVVAEHEPAQFTEQPSAVEYDSSASTMFPVAAVAVAAVAALML